MNIADPAVLRAAKVFTPALHIYYPITVTSAKEYMFIPLRKNTDFSSGLAVLNIGHNHPRVLEAVRNQLQHCVHTGDLFQRDDCSSCGTSRFDIRRS
jgi:4-aminobutyrate aminotransferase